MCAFVSCPTWADSTTGCMDQVADNGWWLIIALLLYRHSSMRMHYTQLWPSPRTNSMDYHTVQVIPQNLKSPQSYVYHGIYTHTHTHTHTPCPSHQDGSCRHQQALSLSPHVRGMQPSGQHASRTTLRPSTTTRQTTFPPQTWGVQVKLMLNKETSVHTSTVISTIYSAVVLY